MCTELQCNFSYYQSLFNVFLTRVIILKEKWNVFLKINTFKDTQCSCKEKSCSPVAIMFKPGDYGRQKNSAFLYVWLMKK